MKNKFIITISDIHGIKQYTLHQFIKLFVLWVVGAIVIFIGIGILIVNSLSTKVDKQAQITQDLVQTKEQLTKNLIHTEKRLNLQNRKLQDEISKKTTMLSSMDEQLSEIEKMVGLQPSIESSFTQRANSAKTQTKLNIEKTKLTIAELTVLNRSIPNGYPLKYKQITSRFGYRIHPITKKYQLHSGIDFSAPIGTPIYAPADGVVEYAQVKGTYGNYLLINHPFGFKTVYGHLENFAVLTGDYVIKGDIIGYVGNTGRSTGPHLHYEIRYLQKWLDPTPFFTWSATTYREVIASQSLVNWRKLMSHIETRLQPKKTYKDN